MNVWERPFVQLFAVFLLLGLLAWWTFQTVSLPPALRDLFEEDEAIASAATPLSEEQRFKEELARLPAPSQKHAPEVAALLQRLVNLPPVPYLLQAALQRDAAAGPGQEPPPWSEAELGALDSIRLAFREAWLPFLTNPPPDWKLFPDSIALFRFQSDFLSTDWKVVTDLVNPTPELAQQSGRVEDPELTLAYLRQIRNLGALDLGGHGTDTMRVANRIMKVLETRVIPDVFSAPNLLAIRENLPPPPTLEDLRAGLEADRSLFLRAADFLESLPPGTSAAAGITRWSGQRAEAAWCLNELGRWKTSRDLAIDLKRKSSDLNLLLQKTFLTGPAWRQWLAGDPAAGLPPLLAQGLGGFFSFEQIRTDDLVARGALDVRIALQTQGADAARRIPDPFRPNSFFQIEETEGRISTFCSHKPAGFDEPARLRLPDSLASLLSPTDRKTSPDAQGL